MDYEKMWNQLKQQITSKAKRPTSNSKNVVKHAEEIAKKQELFDVLTLMDGIEQCHSHSNIDNKYAL